ncbi:hypothetical protein CTAM01_00822 [Colletotrichum tamarilloi]|uniref:Uncharacterized protein n=1 Tax=Colletotrichum tamarilloi TaxID=1209934 RepID=A0ABQ9RTJ2_9PEZI|nr:uncharacterized protein CTAM01_00822 [Colletotrichum tamarilloi]KAK1511892.1 hypothetical protein CTAM01_00822 [Colletotrichum tamarilloi]
MFSTLVPVACRTVRDTLDTTLGSPLFHFRATLSPRPYCPPPPPRWTYMLVFVHP